MRTLRGNNLDDSQTNKKTDPSKNKASAGAINDDDDIGTNEEDTTDDEGGVDTPPPPLNSQIEEDDDLSNDRSENKAEKEIKKAPRTKGKKKKRINEPKEFEVEQIVDMETQSRWSCPVKFRVRWVGYTEKDDSWLPAFQLTCEEAIEEFLEISGRKPEYIKVLEAKKKKKEYIIENQRKSSRNTYAVPYHEIDDDFEEFSMPSGTRSRKFRTPALKKPVIAKVKQTVKHFEVENIIDSRVFNGIKEYKVHWKNYSGRHDSWKRVDTLNCPKLIKKYEDSVKDNSGTSEDDFQVEKILDMRYRRGNKEYLVRWKGFSSSDNTWEPKTNLTGCKQLFTQFIKESTEREDSDEEKHTNASKKSTKKKRSGRSQEESDNSVEEEPAKVPKLKRKGRNQNQDESESSDEKKYSNASSKKSTKKKRSGRSQEESENSVEEETAKLPKLKRKGRNQNQEESESSDEKEEKQSLKNGSVRTKKFRKRPAKSTIDKSSRSRRRVSAVSYTEVGE